MADTRLSTSIESLRQKLKDQIPNANAEQLKRISRSARKLGYTQDTEIETLLNTRANTLIAATTDPSEVETIASALNEMDDTINPTISTSGTLVSGASKIVTDDSAPGNPEDGDLWFKTDDLDLYVYYDDGDTSQWVQVNAASLGENALVTTSSSSPTNPVVGQLWFDTNTNILYVYHNAQWIQIGADLTGLATETYVDTSVANLVDSAPETLDTLNELAAALGDDANFATTVTNSLANKLEASDLNGYATQSYVSNNFATQSYVNSSIEDKTVQVLSGASPQIDLTKNYFKIDLTSDTTFSTTGSTTSGNWYEGKIEIKGKADQLTHNLVTNPSGQISGWRSTASTSTISGFYGQGSSLYGFFGVSPNGQYAITGSYVGTADYKFQIIEFSTPGNITTGSLVYQSGNVHGTIGGLNQRPNAYFATDTKFVTSTGHVITMPTGNITTSNPYGTLPAHSGSSARASRGNWTSDGTRYITVEEEQNQNPIFKLYTASTPFYASTLSLTQSYTFNRFSISGDHPLKIDHGNSVYISDDGLNLYTGGFYLLNNYSSQMIMHFTLSTAFNLSTMSYTSNSLTGATFNYGKFIENGNQYWAPKNDGIFAYQNLNTPAVSKTTTWPDTWSWEGGSSPTPIPNNETDIVNFVTTDGGSTFKASTKKYYN